jgi:hypothetical protein
VRLGVLDPDPRKLEARPAAEPAAGPCPVDVEVEAAGEADRDHAYDCICDWTWLFSPPCLTRAWRVRLGVLLPDAP